MAFSKRTTKYKGTDSTMESKHPMPYRLPMAEPEMAANK